MIAFTHGVASGDPTADGAVLWTRVVDRRSPTEPVDVTCVVASRSADGEAEASVAKISAASSVDRDHTVHLVVDGLEAGRSYTYWFEAGGQESPRGGFRTLPTEPTSLTLGVVSCAKYNAGVFNVYRRVAERRDLDLVVHLGDYIYEAADQPPRSQTPGAGIGRTFDPLHECRTLADYRRRYGQYRSDPDLQALHRAHAVFATLDDHELADNAWAGGAEEHRDDEHGPWSQRLHDALTAWEEWTPSRCRPVSGGDPIYRALPVGSLATIVLLETRLHRTAPKEPDPQRRQQLGDDQLAWLADIAGRGATGWLVVGVPSVLTPLWSDELDAEAVSALRTLKLAEPTEGAFHDLWDTYACERARLLAILDRARAGRLVLSGDVHVSLSAQLDHEGQPVAREWTTASVTSQNLDDKLGWPRRTFSLAHEDAVRRALPHISHCNFDDHGYLVVELTQTAARAAWWAVDTVLKPTPLEYRVHTEVIDRSAR